MGDGNEGCCAECTDPNDTSQKLTCNAGESCCTDGNEGCCAECTDPNDASQKLTCSADKTCCTDGNMGCCAMCENGDICSNPNQFCFNNQCERQCFHDEALM